MTRRGAERVLVVDDDRAFRVSTVELLRQAGYEARSVSHGQAAVESLADEPAELVLLDLRMPGTDGLGVVEALRRWGQDVPIVMVSGYGTVETAVEALQLGADDFLTKPVDPDGLIRTVREVLDRRPGPPGDEDVVQGMVGRSDAIREVQAAIRKVAPRDTTVLVTGETGTGKELVARAVHDLSNRASGPFVAVNCVGLAGGLLESELFGHVRGAFTGAVADKPGLFEAASGGTLFLDEIGDVGPGLQQRLLRALQEREIKRVGAVSSTRVDARVVAATARDLRAEVEAGRFRADLFYRLAVFPVHVPPLRDRRSDIPLLVEALLERHRGGAAEPTCSPLALRLLVAHDWPGNVRELFAVVERAAIQSEGARIEPFHLPEELREPEGGTPTRYSADVGEEDERRMVVQALEQTGWNRTRAARILGMGRTTLWRKMNQLGIEPGSSGADDAG